MASYELVYYYYYYYYSSGWLALCRCAAGCVRHGLHVHGISLPGGETQQRHQLGVQVGQVRETAERHRRQLSANSRRSVLSNRHIPSCSAWVRSMVGLSAEYRGSISSLLLSAGR